MVRRVCGSVRSDLVKRILPLVMAGACAGPAQGSGSVVLSCEPQGTVTTEICAQLHDMVAEAAPGRKIEEIARISEAPADATAVRLMVEALHPDRITAHLEWRQPGAGWTTGETLSLDVMDARLNDVMVAQFLHTLWSRSGIVFGD